MKIAIYDIKNQKAGELDLPVLFSEKVNSEIIKSAVEYQNARNRQPYGAAPDAGKKSVAKLSRRRRKYKGSYGIGISRVPRKIMSKSGTRFNWVGAFAPGTVGGRRAHPPKGSKSFEKKMNKKEISLALRSAIAATVDKDLVSKNNFKIPQTYPFAVEDSFEGLSKTKDVFDALTALGFAHELERASVKKVRAGKGKSRSRRYKKKRSLLLVLSASSPLEKAARNIPGVDAISVDKLNVSILTSGHLPGRAAIFTKKAIERIAKDKMYSK